MTRDELAKLLNGREYGEEMDDAEEREAKGAGLLVVFGYSDDDTEFRGIINDELGCYEGKTFMVHRRGVLESDHDCDCKFCGHKQIASQCITIKAIWDAEATDENGDIAHYSWVFNTTIPHAEFDIMEDGEKYCRGLVIDAKDLPNVKPV